MCGVPDQPLQRCVCAVWAHVCLYFLCGAHGQVPNLPRKDAGDSCVSYMSMFSALCTLYLV